MVKLTETTYDYGNEFGLGGEIVEAPTLRWVQRVWVEEQRDASGVVCNVIQHRERVLQQVVKVYSASGVLQESRWLDVPEVEE